MLRALHVAPVFLTTLPLPAPQDWRADDARRSVRAYPLVGLLLGALLALVAWPLAPLPDPLRGALLLGAWLALTGALHFDGFCDLADAAFVSAPPAERRRIAKDPHLGAFALAAGATLLLVKATALGAVGASALLLVPLLSRTLVVLPLTGYAVHPSSRLGRSVQGSPAEARRTLLGALLLGLGLGLAVAFASGALPALMWLTLAGLATVLVLARWLAARLGGLGGDAYGALIETSETAMLTLAVAL